MGGTLTASLDATPLARIAAALERIAACQERSLAQSETALAGARHVFGQLEVGAKLGHDPDAADLLAAIRHMFEDPDHG
jgi:hypothetical protein